MKRGKRRPQRSKLQRFHNRLGFQRTKHEKFPKETKFDGKPYKLLEVNPRDPTGDTQIFRKANYRTRVKTKGDEQATYVRRIKKGDHK